MIPTGKTVQHIRKMESQCIFVTHLNGVFNFTGSLEGVLLMRLIRVQEGLSLTKLLLCHTSYGKLEPFRKWLLISSCLYPQIKIEIIFSVILKEEWSWRRLWRNQQAKNRVYYRIWRLWRRGKSKVWRIFPTAVTTISN